MSASGTTCDGQCNVGQLTLALDPAGNTQWPTCVKGPSIYSSSVFASIDKQIIQGNKRTVATPDPQFRLTAMRQVVGRSYQSVLLATAD